MISIVAAISSNNLIGNNNELPWHIPEDLAFFKELTYGHTVVMGRKTYESIGKPLPNRKNVVLTQDANLHIDGVTIITDFRDVFDLTGNVFIIGGGEIYELFLPYTDKLYLTLVSALVDGDTKFPSYHAYFTCVWTVDKTDFDCPYNYVFTKWDRRR